jgi:hypothetical protein
MEYSKEDIRQAYIKLKSYVYYDNTDLLLRRQLVEFETGIGKEFLTNNPNSIYNIDSDIFNYKLHFTLEEKFERIAEELNSYHKRKKFFDAVLGKVSIDFYPKKYKETLEEINYISNEKVKSEYLVERITPFINAPIELHIISVLWLLRHGVSIEKNLKPECVGNRLLLNKDKSEIIQGSGLFKPYFNQYQKWRDDAVDKAVQILKEGKSVAFLNLDIKDYFSSVRIKRTELFKGRRHKGIQEFYNLKEIFLKIHEEYSIKLSNGKTPNDFYEELIDENGKLEKVVLPIGLVSSYVLANNYLKLFDEQVLSQVKPAYYGRYVDDLLFVIADPKPDAEIKLNVENSKSLSKIERFVLDTFSPVIDIKANTANSNKNNFVLKDYDALACQSEKSLMHFFNSEDSHLVIDKLKQELDDRTSEFRDFPEEDENNLTFKSSAYHLHYDGSEGKIRTLKDYKENRYGLTVFLSNKIFSALRHDNHLSDDESEQIINFFKGETCLTYYRLWERILTLLLVNKKPKSYVDFFLHCIDQIENIDHIDSNSEVSEEHIQNTLINYLDVAHELALSLNLDFISKTQKVARNFEFKLNKLKKSNWTFLFGRFEPTRSDSFWVRRFRQSNMMRHHYIIHPLITYSEASKRGTLRDLTAIKLDFKNYKLDQDLLENSPRRVKFWECSMAVAFENIGKLNRKKEIEVNGKVESDIFCVIKQKKSAESRFYLDVAFDKFKQINENHIAKYELEDQSIRDLFYKRKSDSRKNSPVVNIQEFRVNDKKKKNNKFKVAFANTKVDEKNIIASLRGTPNLDSERYDKLAKIVKKVRLDKSDLLLFPESFIPINLLSSIVKYSERNEVLTVTGLEHIKIKNTVYNFVVTILPFEFGGVSDAVVTFRLKNNYAPGEEMLIKGNHYKVAKPKEYRYDLFIWRNLYFSPFYCFELANVWHRSLFKSKLDLLVAVEWNKDTNYFSNIVESCSRDLHCFIAQVNTSQFGDSRLTQPTESARQDLLRLKGGVNDSILIAEFDINKIREFQRKTYALTHHEKEYKPLPPDYDVENVLRRTDNESVL